MRRDSAISGVSLGATRILKMTPPKYNKKDTEPIFITLNPGSLYVFKPPTNNHWSHCIEKDYNVKNARISLTYRLS
jgi:alkylated DNA repair dioxygenase AlkB